MSREDITKQLQDHYKKLAMVAGCCDSITVSWGGVIYDGGGRVKETIPTEYIIRTPAQMASNGNIRPYVGQNFEALLQQIYDAEHCADTTKPASTTESKE